MPTYEYSCSDCGEHLEVVQSFRDDPLTVCPSCGGPLRKVFGSIGVVFKGSGFYKTDSRESAKTKRSDKAEVGADSGKSEGSATSGESSGGKEASSSASSDSSGSSEKSSKDGGSGSKGSKTSSAAAS